MGISRQRRTRSSLAQKNGKYIIHTKKYFFKELFCHIGNLIMWAYLLIIYVVFISACLSYNNKELRVLKTILGVDNHDIRLFILQSILWFLVSLAVLSIWRTYNYKRYGKLNRRKQPKDTTSSDILALGLIEPEIYYKLQNNRVTILEESPIRDLKEENTSINEQTY